MKSIWLLAKSNLKKNKGQATTLLTIMVFVAMFITIGVAMTTGIGSFLDRRAAELNTAHFFATLSNYEVGDAQVEFIAQHPLVVATEIFDSVIGGGEITFGENTDFINFMFSTTCSTRQMNPPVPIGDSLPLVADAIFLPKFIWLQGGFALGDTLHINFMETDLYFTVAGYIEKYFFGSMMMGWTQFYVSEEMFAYMTDEFNSRPFGGVHRVMLAQVYDMATVGELSTAYMDFMMQQTGTPDLLIITTMFGDYHMMFGSHTFMTDIVSTLLLFFALVLLVVSLIIIRFRINNSIDESMVNIGILKAVGYSNRQIISSVLMQFGSISFVGGVLGIVFAQLLLPLAIGIMGALFPFAFVPEFDPVVKLLILGVILVCVLLFSLLATRRIYKLFPLVALRGGIATHSFKRNAAPLDKSRGPLALLFAIKDLWNNKRQAIAIGLVVSAISFAGASGIAMHYSININSDEFINSIAGEVFDILLDPSTSEDPDAFRQRLEARPEIYRLTKINNGIRLSVDNEMVFFDVVEDYAKKGGQSLVRGRFPVHYNEVVLGNGVMRATGKDIGDWVTIRSGGVDYEFIITGLVQSSANGGMFGGMTRYGFTRMQPLDDFALVLFVADGVCPSEFADVLRVEEGDNIGMMGVLQEVIDAQMEEMGVIFMSVTVLILAVTAAIVIATMFLVIKTAIIRKRRELGIQKALGFTTWQLMNQISLNLTPAIVIGTILGAVGGYMSYSSLFVLGMSASGIAQANLPSPLSWTIAMCIAFVALAYVVSMLVAVRIRKISAYALVTE